MCPFCLATVGLIVVGKASAGGLTVLAMKASRKKTGAIEIAPKSNERGNQDVNQQD
jgi:hypothetical protein